MDNLDLSKNLSQKPSPQPDTSPSSSKGGNLPPVPPPNVNVAPTPTVDISSQPIEKSSKQTPPIPSLSGVKQNKQTRDVEKLMSEIDKIPDNITLKDFLDYTKPPTYTFGVDTTPSPGIGDVVKGAATVLGKGLGLAGKLGVWTAEGVLRNLISAGLTLGRLAYELDQKRQGRKPRQDVIEAGVPFTPLKNFLKGVGLGPVADLMSDEPVKDIFTRIKEGREIAKQWGEQLSQSEDPFLRTLGWGLKKFPTELSFLTVVGSTGMDLNFVGGFTKNLAKGIIKTGTKEGAINLLKKIGTPEEIALKYANEVVNARTERDALRIMFRVAEETRRKRLGDLVEWSKMFKDPEEFKNAIITTGKAHEVANTLKLAGFRDLQEFWEKRTSKTVQNILQPTEKEPLRVEGTSLEAIFGKGPRVKKVEDVLKREAFQEEIQKTKLPKDVKEFWGEFMEPSKEFLKQTFKEAPPKGTVFKEAAEDVVGKTKTAPPGGGIPGGKIPGGGETPPFDPLHISDFGSPPPKESFAKLYELIKTAKVKEQIKEVERLYSVERGKKAAKIEEIFQGEKIKGEEAFKTAKGRLKGELVSEEAKQLFEPFRIHFKQAEIDEMFDYIHKYHFLRPYEKLHAAEALFDLLQGVIPQKARLAVLEEILAAKLGRKGARDFILTLLSKESGVWGKIKGFLKEILYAMQKSLKAMGDFSAWFRQGGIYTITRPRKAVVAMWQSIKGITDAGFEELMTQIKNHPLYLSARDAGVEFLDPRKVLGPHQEMFASRFLENIPGIGHILQASEKNFDAFLNKAKMDLFADYWDKLVKAGANPAKDPYLLKRLGEVVNVFTGRGDLGVLNKYAPALNAVFFAPRWTMSVLKLMNPFWYASLPGPLRKLVLQDVLKWVAANLSFLGVLYAWKKANSIPDDQLRIGNDPRNSDFGKIIINNRIRISLWRGHEQLAPILGRLITFQRTNLATGEVTPLVPEKDPKTGSYYPWYIREARGVVNELAWYARKKLSPSAGLIVDLYRGRHSFTGEPLTPDSILRNLYMPLVWDDFLDIVQHGGIEAGYGIPTVGTLASFVGFGVQAFEPKPPKRSKFTIPTTPTTTGGTLPIIPPPGLEGMTFPQYFSLPNVPSTTAKGLQTPFTGLGEASIPEYLLPPVIPPNMNHLILPGWEVHLMPFNPETGDLYIWPEEWMGKNPQDWFKQK